MTDLFPDLQETLSPRLKWMAHHGVTTRKHSEGRWIAEGKGERAEAKDEIEAVEVLAAILESHWIN